jgi:hypothetical protein
VPASAKYARGSDAWGLCQKCGLRFYLRDLVLDDYFPGLRVCESCYDTRQPQEFPVDVTDPVALYRPSPEWSAIPSVLAAYGLHDSIILNWAPALPQGGPRIDQYDVWRAESTDGINFNEPMRLVGLPVDYYDGGSLSLFNEEGGGPATYNNGGISAQTLTYEDIGVSTTEFYEYYVNAILNGGRIVRSNVIVVQTSHWNFVDPMFGQPGVPSGTLIYGLYFTSRPYPVLDIEPFHGQPMAPIKAESYFAQPDPFYGVPNAPIAGTLDALVQQYTHWPLAAASQEAFFGTPNAPVSGTFHSVVVNYTYWPTKVAPDEQFYGVVNAPLSGTLAVGLIQYQNWPVKVNQEQFFGAPNAPVGGTLS